MDITDETTGEILVVRDPLHACVAVHIRGVMPDDHRIVQLSRHEARRLAALLLYQAERLGSTRVRPAGDHGDHEFNCA
ncbi:MAG TPA: hypothetical protein VNL37_08285 [Candidatus Polarisedimenticolia bacterium]|nr:hypothetical protein [Candidatus Polarisedimenticolia bacterium]